MDLCWPPSANIEHSEVVHFVSWKRDKFLLIIFSSIELMLLIISGWELSVESLLATFCKYKYDVFVLLQQMQNIVT